MKRTLFFLRYIYLLSTAFAEVGGMVLLVASVMLISSGCVSQEQYEEQVRLHYASLNIINANELEEFATCCPPEVMIPEQTKTTTYQIEALKSAPQGQTLYVLRSKKIRTGGYQSYVEEQSTELNALDVNSGDWFWSSWVPVGGQYCDSAIAPDGKTMALLAETNKGGTTDESYLLSIHNLEFKGQQVDIKENALPPIYSYSFYTAHLRFSFDGKYLAVLGGNPDYNTFHSSKPAIYIYRLPLSDYDNGVKRPITIPMDDNYRLRYESDPITPSHLHIFRLDFGKAYYGIYNTETGEKLESMHLREDLYGIWDVSVTGNRILAIQMGNLTIFKPGGLTEVDTQYPLVKGGCVVSKSERFMAIGGFDYLGKDRPYILSIFDTRNLDRPPSEIRILGLYNSYIPLGSLVGVVVGPEKNDSYAPPPTAIVGNYLFVLRVRSADGKSTDLRTILRYDLRKIPSLWAQDEKTQ